MGAEPDQNDRGRHAMVTNRNSHEPARAPCPASSMAPSASSFVAHSLIAGTNDRSAIFHPTGCHDRSGTFRLFHHYVAARLPANFMCATGAGLAWTDYRQPVLNIAVTWPERISRAKPSLSGPAFR